jgi:O-antigen ligase
VENATSIFSQSSTQTESTKTWRLDWWNIIIDDTFFGPHFWTGRGFGLNLADADGFWDGDNPDAPPLRSPHNAHMTMLARGGIPGIAVWGAVSLSWFVMMANAMLKARRYQQPVWANMFLVVMCYVLAILINASFDVALEGPMQGVWFWCLIGFGIGSSMIYRATLSPSAPQATEYS